MDRVFKRLLSAGAVSASLLITAAGLAQPSASRSDAAVLADLRACSTLERDGARLACFDGVLAAEDGGGPAPAPAGPNAPPAASPVAAPRAVRGPAPAPAAAAEPRSAAAASELAAEPRPAPESASETESAALVAAARAAREEAVRQREERERENDRERTVTIVEINDSLPGEARFLTATGQLYIQTSGGTPRGGFPELPYETVVRDGALGSLFLYLSERQRVRVRIAE